MDTQSRPKLEDLVRYDIETSAYRRPDEYVEHAVSLLQAHQTWFTEHRAENLEKN